MDQREPFSAFSSASEGKAGSGAGSGIRFLVIRLRQNGVLACAHGNQLRENLPRVAPRVKIASKPNIPFLGIKQVNSMKKVLTLTFDRVKFYMA